MKLYTLLPSLLLSTLSFANELPHFSDIKSAVIHGQTIHITIDLSKCISASNKNGPELISVYTPKAIQVFNKYMATSLTHFTLNNHSMPNKPVYDYVKYKIADDDTLTLTYQVLNANDFTPMTDKSIYTCLLENGVTVYN